jgi:hypothetical protein
MLDIVDDATSRGWSIPVSDKLKALSQLISWHLTIENRTGEHIKVYNIDNGELKSTEFLNFCVSCGVEVRYTLAETSAQNGKVEHFHLTTLNKARAMMVSCDAPLFLWDEFVVTAAYLHTRSPLKSQSGRTPFKRFEGKKQNISHLREIGCRAFVLIRGHNPKLHARSVECVLIGYTPQAKAYCCWEHSTGKVYNSIDIRFIESDETVCVWIRKDALATHPPCPTNPTLPTVPDDQSSDDPRLTTSAPPDPTDPTPTVPVPAPVPAPGLLIDVLWTYQENTNQNQTYTQKCAGTERKCSRRAQTSIRPWYRAL